MPRPVLLIAGGSRGIGAATAGSPARAAMTSRSTTRAMPRPRPSVVEAVKAAGGKAVAIARRHGQARPTSSACSTTPPKTLGPLTHFVHRPGIIGPYSRLDEADAADDARGDRGRTFGALLCLRACRPPHVDEARRQGRLDRDAVVDGGDDRRRRRMRLVRGRQGRGRFDGRSASRARSPRKACASTPSRPA